MKITAQEKQLILKRRQVKAENTNLYEAMVKKLGGSTLKGGVEFINVKSEALNKQDKMIDIQLVIQDDSFQIWFDVTLKKTEQQIRSKIKSAKDFFLATTNKRDTYIIGFYMNRNELN